MVSSVILRVLPVSFDLIQSHYRLQIMPIDSFIGCLLTEVALSSTPRRCIEPIGLWSCDWCRDAFRTTKIFLTPTKKDAIIECNHENSQTSRTRIHSNCVYPNTPNVRKQIVRHDHPTRTSSVPQPTCRCPARRVPSEP